MNDPTEKRRFLQQMRSEVDDFHPLLQMLLAKLPDVEGVEYTHGTAEMGADFIVQKRDNSTSKLRYVGIIAKLGKIQQKETDEVERQLKECFVPRKIDGGKQRIYLNEVWVICTDTISTNAQEKFLDDRSFRSVQFLKGDDVIALIDQHSPEIWKAAPGVLGQYLTNLLSRLDELDQSSSILGKWTPTRSLDLHLSVVDPNELRRAKRPERVTLLPEIEQRRMIFIEGDPGSGKSHLMRNTARMFTRGEFATAATHVPIYTSYRDFATKDSGSLRKCVERELGLAIKARTPTTRLVLFLDGFDEHVSDVSYNDRLNEIALQVRDDTSLTAVIASRSGVVPENTFKTLSDVRHLHVSPLSVGQIVAFVKEIVVSAKKSPRILSDIERSELFRQLPRNPIAALLLSKLLMEDLEELPQTLTELYQMSLELILGRWDIAKNLVTQQEYEVARKISATVAHEAMHNEQAVFTVAEIEQQLRRYLNDRNLATNVDRLLDRLTGRAGLFALDGQAGTATFRHRSFAEFLCAHKMIESGEVKADERVLSPYWHHTFFFVCGINPDCEHILRSVLAVAPNCHEHKWTRLLTAADYLLAAHMSPYRIVEETLPEMMLEAASLYQDVVEKRVQSPLSSFSELQLLGILTYLIRNTYGYRYFRKARPAAAIAISDSTSSDAEKAIALFFLGTVGLEAGSEDAFSFLVEEYEAREVPFFVALAVDWELTRQKISSISARVRAFNKHARRLLRARTEKERVTNEVFLKRLMKTPIDGSGELMKERKSKNLQKRS